MLPSVPLYVSLVFGLTSCLTLFLFYLVVRNSQGKNNGKQSRLLLLISLAWLLLQGILSWKGIYSSNLNALPPKIFLFGMLPLFLLILLVFLTPRGRSFVDELDLKSMTWLHIVRIPVELVLFWLAANKAVPELMSFLGRNFDILSGLSAPFIVFFAFRTAKLKRSLLLFWNFACLALLINIVIHAFLAVPTPLQQLAFEQPNIGILYFPFSWLPTFVVPVVLFCHLAAIRRLIRRD